MKFLFYFLPFYIVLLTAGITYNLEKVKLTSIEESISTIIEEQQEPLTYIPFADELPKTHSVETDPLIYRLTNGIINRKVKQGVWWECGQKYSPKDYREAALDHAHNIVRVARKYNINPWGVAATIAKESKFDRCAVGRYTRNWARKRKLLEPRFKGHFRKTLSHPREDVVKLLNSRRWKASWKNADIGGMQVLWPVYYSGPAKDMLTLEPGLDIQAKKMSDWAKFYKTKTPWAHWTGSRWSKSRHQTILRIARGLGAKKGEI